MRRRNGPRIKNLAMFQQNKGSSRIMTFFGSPHEIWNQLIHIVWTYKKSIIFDRQENEALFLFAVNVVDECATTC